MVVEKAKMRDIPALLALVNGYATQGIMLPRTEFEFCEYIRDFLVARHEGHLIGCGALHIYTRDAAEVRSLAVDPAAKASGVGRQLVEALEAEARESELGALFAFTYVPGFFRKLGFQEVDRGVLPLKVWKDCLRCPKFRGCDEIAMLKLLAPEFDLKTLMRDAAYGLTGSAQAAIELPVLKA